MFQQSPDDLDMHVVYDVSHNIAKVEEHYVDGEYKQLLVHRKGSTRSASRQIITVLYHPQRIEIGAENLDNLC